MSNNVKFTQAELTQALRNAGKLKERCKDCEEASKGDWDGYTNGCKGCEKRAIEQLKEME